jgi:hypothetical protein
LRSVADFLRSREAHDQQAKRDQQMIRDWISAHGFDQSFIVAGGA